ncbi:MAG: D-alanyl-D-alanine carboxypeptidase family protein [Intestinibacter bartlettii]
MLLNKMQQDAQKIGINLYIISRYRSYSLQKWLYDKYKSESKDVDTFSAKAGYSEHQTGLAFDLNDSKHQ